MKIKKISALILLAGMPAYTNAETMQLKAIEVTTEWVGETTKENAKTYPGSRDVITKEEIKEKAALNLEDVLRSYNGIQVLDETGTGILPNIGIRGLNPLRSERLQMLVDGYPIAIGPYTNVGVSLFPVTIQSIDAIDIIRGGASVHYGPNNVGGILNLVTQPISRDLEQTLSERMSIAEETGNIFYDTYYSASNFLTDDFGIRLQMNIQSGEGFREHSDTDVQNIILDTQYFVDDKNELKTQFQYYNVEADLPGALSPSSYEVDRTQSERPYDTYDADMWRGTLTWTHTINDNVEFEWRNFAHKADRTFHFGQDLSGEGLWSDPAGTATHIADSPRLFHVYSTEPRITINHDRHTLMAGIRYVKEKVDFDVNRLEIDSDNYNAVRQWRFDTDAIAIYLSDSISVFDDKLVITPGLRYEDVSTDFTDKINNVTDSNDTDEFLPGITIGLQATDSTYLFTNAQRSLVPVQTAQVTREGEVANELAWNYELGARTTINTNLSLSSTLFRIDYKDQIQFNRTSGIYENLGETRHQGVELTADLTVTDNLFMSLGYTYLDTEQRAGTNKGNELANAPNHHVSASANYYSGPWITSVSAIHVSKSYSDADNTKQETASGSAGELPSYTTVSTRVARQFVAGSNNLELGLSVNNLFDEDYYFRGVDVSPVGRLPSPGRTFILEGTFNF